MQTKLTLRIDDDLVQQAKDYAKLNNKSVSQIVADYFRALTASKERLDNAPITQSLIGVLDVQKVDEKDHKKHLKKKFYN